MDKSNMICLNHINTLQHLYIIKDTVFRALYGIHSRVRLRVPGPHEALHSVQVSQSATMGGSTDKSNTICSNHIMMYTFGYA